MKLLTAWKKRAKKARHLSCEMTAAEEEIKKVNKN